MSSAARNMPNPAAKPTITSASAPGRTTTLALKGLSEEAAHDYRLYALRKGIRQSRAGQEGRGDRRRGSAGGPGEGLTRVCISFGTLRS